MNRDALISKWKELEFKYNGEDLKGIDFDDYSIAELKDEISCLRECLSNSFD